MASSSLNGENTPLLSNQTKASYLSRLNIPSDVEPIYRTQNHHQQESSSKYTAIVNDDIEPEKLLDYGMEGFDYDLTQNEIFIKEQEANARKRSGQIRFLRYVVLFFIGFFTGLAAFTFDICIEKLSSLKFHYIGQMVDKYRFGHLLLLPGFAWCSVNGVAIAVCATMVVLLAPVAAGSGIPQVKCYLNGINVPFMMRALTLMTKGFGVVLSVAGGLAVGKEGPMIHTGAGIAAGISQGRLTWFGRSFRLFRQFRNDQEKRDFVSAGTAAGVAAAFGSPVGGLLFSLEEGASFVNQKLTWKILFSSMVSMFTLSFFRSLQTEDKVGNFKPGGLISFGTFDNLNSYTLLEILLFIAIGAIGGVFGALFNKINLSISKFRNNNINTNVTKVMEAVLVAGLTAAVGFTMMIYKSDCRSLGTDPLDVPLQMFCSDSEYNSVGSLFFQTPEKSVRSLFHDPPATYTPSTLALFAVVYFALACYTYGLAVPSGLFIPCLLCGAAWGRLIGNGLYMWQPGSFPDPGKFALIGAAAQLGGVVRMTVSLTVILMEATGNIVVGLPLLITLVVAKYFGDIFNEGIYDLHIDLNGWALLPWQPEELSVTKKAYDGMSSPVTHLSPVMRVGDLVNKVIEEPHHAFPVVEGIIDPDNHRYGTLVGMISREHLSLIVQKRVFHDDSDHFSMHHGLKFDDYDRAYPRFPKFMEVAAELTDSERDNFINLRYYMNEAPYRVPETMTMNRVFNLFRLLGLRHLPVVDNANQVRGIITRKDIRRFRVEHINGEIVIEELLFSRQM